MNMLERIRDYFTVKTYPELEEAHKGEREKNTALGMVIPMGFTGLGNQWGLNAETYHHPGLKDTTLNGNQNLNSDH